MKECFNCKAEIKAGVVCGSCDAVLTIRTHFETFAGSPASLKALFDAMEFHGVDSPRRLEEMALASVAPQMAALARRCIEVEARHEGSFKRSIALMKKPFKPVDPRTIAEAIAQAVASSMEQQQ